MLSMHCFAYVVLIVFLTLCERLEVCTGKISGHIDVESNLTYANEMLVDITFQFHDLSYEEISLAAVNISNSTVTTYPVWFSDEKNIPTKASTKFFITLDNVTIDKASIVFNINFPPGSRILMNNTNINIYQTTPISFSDCTLRDNVTVHILNTYAVGIEPERTYSTIDAYTNVVLDSFSAFIVQHLTSVNARGVLDLGHATISEQSTLALDDVNCYNCSESALSVRSLNVVNGSMLRLSKVVLMSWDESYSLQLVYGESFINVINESLFAMRDCASSNSIFYFNEKNFTLVNNSVLSLTRVSAARIGMPWSKMLPTEVDDKSFTYAQQLVLGKSKVNNPKTLWTASLGVDAIVDENTGYMQDTDVCGYAECIPANSIIDGNTDTCSCQCRESNAHLPQCSLIDDSIQSMIDYQTLQTEQEHCAVSDASNYKICRVCDTGYVHIVPFYKNCEEILSKGECKEPIVCVKNENTDKAFVYTMSYKTASLLAFVFVTTILTTL